VGEDLGGMNVALIGGSGFIGTVLGRHLRRRSIGYFIVDKRPSPVPEVDCRIADVRDSAGLSAALKGADAIINLAAEHRDDVRPRSLYEEVNVRGARNVVGEARRSGIERIVFTSSVAVYGLGTQGTDETGSCRPFNEYGRTKMEAEAVYRAWFAEDPKRRSLVLVRPTVVFGERNRGNVYNLLAQIASGRFLMVGRGSNRKSMAYVENVAAFIAHSLGLPPGEQLFNYVDKPDLDMNALVSELGRLLGRRRGSRLRIPLWVGLAGGKVLDLLGALTRRTFPISEIRIRKFTADTVFCSSRLPGSGFAPPFTLLEGLERTVRHEFIERHEDELFFSE
jgi:nucleoside-diphosphate-sugar epimerase